MADAVDRSSVLKPRNRTPNDQSIRGPCREALYRLPASLPAYTGRVMYENEKVTAVLSAWSLRHVMVGLPRWSRAKYVVCGVMLNGVALNSVARAATLDPNATVAVREVTWMLVDPVLMSSAISMSPWPGASATTTPSGAN